MSISEEQVRDALRSVRYPGFSRDIVSFGLIKGIEIDKGEVKVQLALAANDPNVPATIKSDAEKALRTIDGVRSAKVLIDIHAPPGGSGATVGALRIPGIKHVIAVASGFPKITGRSADRRRAGAGDYCGPTVTIASGVLVSRLCGAAHLALLRRAGTPT